MLKKSSPMFKSKNERYTDLEKKASIDCAITIWISESNMLFFSVVFFTKKMGQIS